MKVLSLIELGSGKGGGGSVFERALLKSPLTGSDMTRDSAKYVISPDEERERDVLERLE